jgi:HK97 gp10 family phage protein
MADFGIEIPRLAEVIKAFEDLDKRARSNALRAALRAATQPVLAAAKAKAPVDTGRLRKSLATTVSTKQGRSHAAIGLKQSIMGNSGWYGRMIETGTAKMPARPYLRPAFDESAGAALERFAEAFEQEIGKRSVE